MIDRKRKLKFIQFFLLTLGVLIIYLTYYDKNNNVKEELISKSKKEKIQKQLNLDAEGDIFFNVEYSGLDLNGNRYLLKSKEAYLDDSKPEIVYMDDVDAIFYFKDNTTLYLWANKGVYNNKNFDMKFETNVKAEYLNSNLFADKAEYSNSENYLSIYGNVKVDDIQGNLIADKLIFDITKQKLDITSFNNGKINAKVNLDEKRF
jgi:hypothetical protein